MQLSLLSRVMLVLSVLTSVLLAGVLGLVLYLFIGGYSGGNTPTSVTPVLFPIALLILVVVDCRPCSSAGPCGLGTPCRPGVAVRPAATLPRRSRPAPIADSAVVAWPDLVASRTGALAG
jgi:hypothetical protein